MPLPRLLPCPSPLGVGTAGRTQTAGRNDWLLWNRRVRLLPQCGAPLAVLRYACEAHVWFVGVWSPPPGKCECGRRTVAVLLAAMADAQTRRQAGSLQIVILSSAWIPVWNPAGHGLPLPCLLPHMGVAQERDVTVVLVLLCYATCGVLRLAGSWFILVVLSGLGPAVLQAGHHPSPRSDHCGPVSRP